MKYRKINKIKAKLQAQSADDIYLQPVDIDIFIVFNPKHSLFSF
jgi:hypothetical protein